MDVLFPDEAALLRHRTRVQATVMQAWCELMKGTPAPKSAEELFKKIQRTSVPLSPTQNISAIRFFLNALQEQIDVLHQRLDSSPYAGRMMFPGKVYSVIIICSTELAPLSCAS